MAEGDPGLLKQSIEVLKEFAAAIIGPILVWVGYTYTRYRKDRSTLKRLSEEQLEYKRRFGVGLVEHTKDIEDELAEHGEELNRCRRIHTGLADNETSISIVSALRQEIKIVEAKLDAHRLDEIRYKESIDSSLGWIKKQLGG